MYFQYQHYIISGINKYILYVIVTSLAGLFTQALKRRHNDKKMHAIPRPSSKLRDNSSEVRAPD